MYNFFSKSEDFCDWSDDNNTHLVCKEGFNFPLDEYEADVITLSVHSEKVTAVTDIVSYIIKFLFFSCLSGRITFLCADKVDNFKPIVYLRSQELWKFLICT